MPEYDPELIVDQVTMLGLVSRQQMGEAMADVEDGRPDTLLRMLLRKGFLTSWQIERLKKGDPSGFFFGESKVLFHLAEGTFARVYRGVHAPTNKPLAIKVLRQRFAQIPEAVERFHKEAEAGMKLRHPNIVQVIEVGQQENRHFMIMEYVEGMNLRDFMKLRVRIPPMQAVPLMLGMAKGLQYSLSAGVTHRDIKGTNILISNTGEAKLVDFGLATMHGDESKPGVKSQRTVDYSALERTCGSPKGDPRSDIYFLGCVFYQMLTGKLPMEESESKDMLRKMLKRSFGAIKPIAEHQYAPDEDLCLIVEKMMKVDLKAQVPDDGRHRGGARALPGRARGRGQVGQNRQSGRRERAGRRGIRLAFRLSVRDRRARRRRGQAPGTGSESRAEQDRPLRRNSDRNPGRAAKDPCQIGLSRLAGHGCGASGRTLPRIAGECRDRRHRWSRR